MIRVGNLVINLDKLNGFVVNKQKAENETLEQDMIYSIIFLLDNVQPVSVEFTTEEEMNLNVMRIETEFLKREKKLVSNEN